MSSNKKGAPKPKIATMIVSFSPLAYHYYSPSNVTSLKAHTVQAIKHEHRLGNTQNFQRLICSVYRSFETKSETIDWPDLSEEKEC